MTRIKLPMAGAAVVLTLGLAACATGPREAGAQGGATVEPAPAGGVGASAGMCLESEPNCMDTLQLADDQVVTIDDSGIKQLRRDAQFYLGAKRNELNETLRVGRIGDEHMALTDDYVVGRITVELDDVDGDVIVTRATVELPGGPETFELGG